MGERAAGFDWWGPHDRATRRARLAFFLIVGALAAYAAAVVIIAVTCLRLAEVGPWRGLATASDRLGPWGLAGLSVVLYGLVASLLTAVAWGGFAPSIRGFAGARPPNAGEADDVITRITVFVLARGVPQPRLWLVDDPAPNGFAFGRARAGHVCLTTGALRLPPNELDALCAYLVTATTMPAYVYALSAADSLLVCGFATNVLWTAAVLVLLSSAIGVPGVVVAVAVLGIAALVVAMRPVLIVADRMLPALFDDVAALCDLETIRCTAQPSALGSLLVHLLENGQRVATRWEVAHLWFERDVVEVVARRPAMLARLVDALPLVDSLPEVRVPSGRMSRRGLADRATTAIELADGAPELTARLQRATATGLMRR